MNASDIAKTLRTKRQPMTLTRQGVGVFDPVTGGMTGGVVETFTVYGITKNYNSISRLAAQNSPNSLILSGDKQAILDATVKPLPSDTLTVMGEVWTVIAVDELSPQGVALMCYCQIRK